MPLVQVLFLISFFLFLLSGLLWWGPIFLQKEIKGDYMGIFSLATLILFLLFGGLSEIFSQSKITINFTDSSVVLNIIGLTVKPGFSPGNHHPDDFLQFKKEGNKYEAILPVFQRGMSSGKVGKSIIYHISSGYVPNDLARPLIIKVKIPKGMDLIWHGKIWQGNYVEQKFSDYFIAREFPIILVQKGSYVTRTSRFNGQDSLTGVYVLGNEVGHDVLPEAYEVVDSASLKIGAIAPNFLEKVVNYDNQKFFLVYFIDDETKVLTGLEHYNSSFSITSSIYLSEEAIFHTLFHSLIGKGVIPKEYMKKDGYFFVADGLGLYEGLTTFMSLKNCVKKNFSAFLSAYLYRAKLKSNFDDLRFISLDMTFESYYAKGFLFWILMQANGMDVDSFTNWLLEIHLKDKKFPIKADWGDVLKWIKVYDRKLGKIAEENYTGDYIQKGFEILQKNGWNLIPVWNIPRWYDMYVGPYPVTPDGIQLPTDNYKTTNAYPMFLIGESGEKLPLEPKINNPALQFIKSHPDSIFLIQFSDGYECWIENKLKFSDGSPYFMHGTIEIDDQNKKFWRKLNCYIE